MRDTIFALATAPGRAAVAVMRLSGPGARSALEALAGRAPAARRASVRRLRGASGETLDTAVVLCFPAPASFTGEDCVELHLHGGQGVIDGVAEALLALGLRLAEPGEFTRRAFENGKLELDQAEAVADLVEAETTAQARQALGQLDGRLGERYRAWREGLIEALARLEAAVDFPDEEIPTDLADQARQALVHLAGDLDEALARVQRGRQVREGYQICVIGAPNSGKSSLLNALAGRPAAIVAPSPGTTRDIVEVPLVIDGFKVVVSDTAGLRDTVEPVEAEGVRRAQRRAQTADLRLWVVDRSADAAPWRAAAAHLRPGDVCILNKSDLPRGADEGPARAAGEAAGAAILSTSLSIDGAGAAMEAMAFRVRRDLSGADFPAATRARHMALLREARARLGAALDGVDAPELAAEDVRLAARALARLSGRIDADDVLARVFATFCIGK